MTDTNTHGLTPTLPLTLSIQPNVVSVTSNISIQSCVVGRTITPITFTFSSAAGTAITTVTSNVTPGIFGDWTSGNQVTLTGRPTGVASGNMTVTATATDGASATGTVAYSTTNDVFVFSSVPSSPFLFRQNSMIDPIEFSAVSTYGSAPIVYFTNTPALPTGLYVTPAGYLQGTPTVAISNAPLLGITATNGYVTVSPSGLSYTVLIDEVLATSAQVSNALVPSATVGPYALTLQTLSAMIPTGNITFSSYTYGITATSTSIGGTLGACVYPDVVLPSYTVLAGTFAGGVPVVFGLGNATPQTISRYTLRSNGTTYAVCRDNGAFAYSNLTTRTATRPRDFQWNGNTLVIADGTPDLLVSSNSIDFTTTSPHVAVPGSSNFLQCAYIDSQSVWIALSSTDACISSNADPTAGWHTNRELLGASTRSDGSFILRTMQMSGSTRFLLGGQLAYYCDVLNSTLTTGTGTLTFTNFSTSLTDIWAITATSRLVIGGGVVTPPGPTIQYSSDSGATWSNASNSFTTRTTDIVTGPSGWLAVGSNGTTPGIKYSADAATWLDVPLTFTPGTTLGPIQFDGTSWCVFLGSNVYRHDALGPTMTTASTWTVTPATFAGSSPTDVLYTFPKPLYSGGPPTPVLYIGVTPNGPTFTSPAVSTFLLYQYVPMTAITFTAVSDAGDTPVYFLASAPPAGMTWTPSTATLSGLSVELGTYTVHVYAQSLVGISKKAVVFVVSQVQVPHKTPTAAAYTAYQRAKVIADAATATVNDHAVPFEVGPFLLNRPPNKTDAPEVCCDTQLKNN